MFNKESERSGSWKKERNPSAKLVTIMKHMQLARVSWMNNSSTTKLSVSNFMRRNNHFVLLSLHVIIYSHRDMWLFIPKLMLILQERALETLQFVSLILQKMRQKPLEIRLLPKYVHQSRSWSLLKSPFHLTAYALIFLALPLPAFENQKPIGTNNNGKCRD